RGGMDKGRGQSALHRDLAEQAETNGRFLYEKVYCARGDMENRIKECQSDLFADQTSTATIRAIQLQLRLASFAEATCGTIPLKLLPAGRQHPPRPAYRLEGAGQSSKTASVS